MRKDRSGAHGTLLDIDLLHTLVAIADTGSFSAAAKVVGRSSSAVSMQIRRLEEQIGTSLFLRETRRVLLTSAGEKLLFQARRMIALSNEVVAQLLTPDLQGVVTLGVPSDIAERRIPRLLKEFDIAYPSIAVNVVVGNSENLIERAEKGTLDLAIVNFASEAIRKPGELLAVEQTVWVGCKGGRAHARDPLPLALYQDGCIWRAAAIRQLEDIGRRFRVAYTSNHNMMQRSVIAADLAVAPLPASYVCDGMVVLGLSDGFAKLPSFDVRLLTVAAPSPPTRAVSEFLRSTLKG